MLHFQMNAYTLPFKPTALLMVFLSFVLHMVVVLQILMGGHRYFDILLYAAIAVVLPLCTAVILLPGGKDKSRLQAYRTAIIGSSSLAVAVVALMFSLASIIIWVGNISPDLWKPFLFTAVAAISLTHVLILVLLGFELKLGSMVLPINFLGNPKFREVAVGENEAAAMALVAILMAVQLDHKVPFFGTVIGLFKGLSNSPSAIIYILATVGGVLVVRVSLFLMDYSLLLANDKRQKTEETALVLVIAATFLVYFDVRFDSDVLHFLTIAGPANQILHAQGVPMIDTFSQYGLGPLLGTWLAFAIAGPNIHSANAIAQLHSFALYSCVLVCMYRITQHKLAALWLGFFAVAILLSGWWYGNYSMNSVPSSMGMRYLPSALVALSISMLNEKRSVSLPLVAAVTLSGLWSFEAFVCGAAIVSLFICLEFARSLDWRLLFRSIMMSLVLPVLLTVVIISIMTLLLSDNFPNFQPYFDFIMIYNMTSEFWALPASGQYFGWLAVAAAVGLTLSFLWYLALHSLKVRRYNVSGEMDTTSKLDIYTSLAIRRGVPLAGLTTVMSSYYVGRSVDFTLIISFIPFSAMAIPAFLALVSGLEPQDRTQKTICGLLGGVIALSVAFSFLGVFRSNGPYKPLISSLVTLDLAAIKTRFNERPMLDRLANPNYFDQTGLAQDALRAINTFAPEQDQLTVLLGLHPTTPWSVHSDMVLLLSGIGNRWPISYVLSDELSPARSEQILQYDAALKSGEIVIVRGDESLLGPLEAGILVNIRRNHALCRKLFDSGIVSVYSVSDEKDCTAE